MAQLNQPQDYSEQINEIVQGLMQVWVKFDTVLPAELSKIQHQLEGIRPEGEHHPETNYQLFYRFSSSIYGKANLTMGELSSAMSVPLSTATRMVDLLVNRGYAQRLPDAEDRRIVRIALTESGRELHKTINSYIAQRVKEILAHLSVAERNQLFTIIRKVVSAFKEAAV
jgi:DNA-binding MarR family transcriptional regulator